MLTRLQVPAWRCALLPFAFAAACAPAHAAPLTVNFAGVVDFIQEDEYGTAQPIPPGATPLLPLFSGATRVLGSYTYDPALSADLDPDPSAGQYLATGTLTLSLPDIGLAATASGQLGISVYTAGEFHVASNDVTSFSGNWGGATPFSLFVALYLPLTSDGLPTAALPWNYANVHFDLDGVSPPRDIFIALSPVPELPTHWLMLAPAIALCGLSRRRRNEG